MTTTTMAIGIDVGDKKSDACALDDTGAMFSRGELPSTREASCAGSNARVW